MKMQKSAGIDRKMWIDICMVLCITLVLFIPRVSTVVRMEGDDTNNVLWREAGTTVFEYLKHCYLNATGRITARFLEWCSGAASVAGWRVLETVAMCLFSVLLYAFTVLAGLKNRILRILFAGCSAHLMSGSIFTEAILWIAGSCNYHLVLIPGLAGALLFAHAAFSQKPARAEKVLGTIGMALSAMGNEQICCVLLALMGILFAVRIRQKKRVREEGIATALLLAILLICYVFCPGTAERIERELYYIPDFYTIPMRLHIRYAWQWLCGAWTVNMAPLPIVLFGLEGIVLWMQKTGRGRIPGAAAFIMCGMFAFGTFFGHTFFVDPGWGELAESQRGGMFLLIFWTVAVVYSVIVLFVCFREKRKRWIAALLLAGGYASIAIMTLSPTMIASEMRTQYACSILMILVIGFLLAEAEKLIKMCPSATRTLPDTSRSSCR